jgi:hypothetical protein
MVRHAKSPKSTRKNKKTLKAKKNSPKRLRKNKTTRNKNTRRNVKKHRRYGGAPPTDEIPTDEKMPPTEAGEKEMPQKAEEEEECAICQEIHDDDVIIKTDCGHSFHKKCLGLWCNTRASDDDKTCPICRANIAVLCDNIKPFNSLGIMRHLDAMFFNIGGYAGRDVEARRLENNRIIHEYLDNPEFDPNVSDNENRTPLYVAVERSRDDVIDKLLKRPDINTEIRETRSDKTPLELAIANNNLKAIALFKKYKKIPKALKGLV